MTGAAAVRRDGVVLSPGRGAAPQNALEHALREVGVTAGATVFVHADLRALGGAGLGQDASARATVLFEALRRTVGEHGTVLVPTYTFSFCRGELFDPGATPTVGGPWAPSAEFLELVRTHPGAVRSNDPIHSVAGVGPRAADLLLGAAPTCFGEGSVFARLVRERVTVVMVGLPLEEATVRHHTEEVAAVPFRYRKLFTGRVRADGRERKQGWVYSVRLLADEAFPDGRRLEVAARAAGVCRSAALGETEILAVDAGEYHAFTRGLLRADAWLTARGPAADPAALERARVGARLVARPALPGNASMREMIDALWRLPRDIVSDGYDAALDALATQLPTAVHEFPSGSECWSWVVPEQWSCHEAWLETLDGRRLFSYADHPLHVVSYSLPFEGEVTRDELFRHLHVHPLLPDAVPFIFTYYERDWGLCCSRAQRDALRDERYRVVIRTSARYGHLRVGEVVAPGDSDESVVLCAHLCHPHMVNDDLSGVVVGVEVMRALLARPRGRYTYRFLIVPETIGSVAWLSRHERLVPRLRGGLFLEMLGLDRPHALQHSFAGDTDVDRCFELALRAEDRGGWTGAFRTIIGNDERQFNAPGVRVPMLSLSRVCRPDDPAWPYPEYHSSADVPALASDARLAESRDLVLRMLDVLERDVVPAPRYPGEVFCSRFGIHVDAYENPDGHRALFDILYLIDGTRSISEIARQLGIPFDAACSTVDELRRRGVVS